MTVKLSCILLMVLPYFVIAQNDTARKKDGLLVFETSSDIYRAYFILSPVKKFDLLTTHFDTANAFSIGYDFGGHVDLINEFKEYITRQFLFDSATYLVAQENYQGIPYEDSLINFSRFGTIRYLEENGFALAPRFKTIFIRDGNIVLKITRYQRIEEFYTDQENK